MSAPQYAVMNHDTGQLELVSAEAYRQRVLIGQPQGNPKPAPSIAGPMKQVPGLVERPVKKATAKPAKPRLNPLTKQRRKEWAEDIRYSAEKRGHLVFGSFEEQLAAIIAAERPNRTRRVDARLRRAAPSYSRLPTGMGEVDPSTGGFALQEDWARDWVASIYEVGNVAKYCTKLPISDNANELHVPAVIETSRVTGSRWGGVTGYWKAEADQVTASKVAYGEIRLDKKKLFVLAYTSHEMLDDIPALSAWLQRVAVSEFAFLLDRSILGGSLAGTPSGTGAGLPLSVLASPGTITVAKDTGQAAATVSLNNVNSMWQRLAGPSRSSAVWFCSEEVETALEAAAATAASAPGVVSMYYPRGVDGNPYPLLKGRPLCVTEAALPLGTSGDLVLGDFSKYLLLEPQASSALSLHLQWLTDEVVFRFTLRTDGAPAYSAPITSASGSAITHSPFVCLASR
jgi:HK97 family phage major capsid protein